MSDDQISRTVPGMDRRGLDAAVVAYVKQLHEQFMETHAYVHETFVESHEREHNLRTDTMQQALDLSSKKHQADITAIYHFYDTVLSERDIRYEQRSNASQLALTAAFDAREKALQEAFEAREKALAAALEAKDKAVAFAFEASEKAIQKAEVSIIKQSDATYVTLNELSKSLAAIMPRNEAEQRFSSMNVTIDDLRDRVKGMEAVKQGGQEQRVETRAQLSATNALLGLIISVVVIVGFVLAANAFTKG